jgi:hypothetical protein
MCTMWMGRWGKMGTTKELWSMYGLLYGPNNRVIIDREVIINSSIFNGK